jgi:hypothetical protein
MPRFEIVREGNPSPSVVADADAGKLLRGPSTTDREMGAKQGKWSGLPSA